MHSKLVIQSYWNQLLQVIIQAFGFLLYLNMLSAVAFSYTIIYYYFNCFLFALLPTLHLLLIHHLLFSIINYSNQISYLYWISYVFSCKLQTHHRWACLGLTERDHIIITAKNNTFQSPFQRLVIRLWFNQHCIYLCFGTSMTAFQVK